MKKALSKIAQGKLARVFFKGNKEKIGYLRRWCGPWALSMRQNVYDKTNDPI